MPAARLPRTAAQRRVHRLHGAGDGNREGWHDMGDARPPGVPPDAQETVLPASDGATPTALFGNRYRIERIIGEGAFGRVYLAMDSRLRRNVAIKELLASRNTTDHTTYARYLERFQREARAAGMVQQPNV